MGLKHFYLIFIICGVLLISECKAHSHDHDHHDHESPSFKYSREANEKPHHVHHSDEHVHKETHKQVPTNVNSNVWLHAMGSTFVISVAPVILLFFVPLHNTAQQQSLLKILLAFASGGLLGDAFLHLIPHASMNIDPEHGHSHDHHAHDHGHEEGHVHDMSIGLWVLCGILLFLVIEKGVRLIKGGHSHSHGKKEANDKPNKKTEKKTKDDSGDTSNKEKEVKEGDNAAEASSEIKVAGWLNLAADFSHNFTDGLAIGASYLAGDSIGLATTITILLHEVPHEIGDFAILLQSGVSRRKAMLFQLVTALGALAGTALSLCGYDLLGANWILPFTAGGFIYIALVSVIPELLEEEKPRLTQTILQLLAMLGGVYMMVLMTEFE